MKGTITKTFSAPRLGFVILSYNEPEQLLYLTKTLGSMFNDPPIICHHNFDQCAMPCDPFPPYVRFIHPHIKTQWGHITTPLAALKAFTFLRDEYAPDWYFLLSGSDYPVMTSERIVAELANTPYDVFLDHREIALGVIPPGQTAKDGSFSRPEWISVAYDRYCAYRLFWWPYLSLTRLARGIFPIRKKHLMIRNPRVLSWIQRNQPSRIFGGRFWFHANHKAICHLLDRASSGTLRFYWRRPIPEESLFHTILRDSDLQICADSKRYEDWPENGRHPKWLTLTDVPNMLNSNAYFARKFRPDSAVQKAIDRAIGNSL